MSKTLGNLLADAVGEYGVRNPVVALTADVDSGSVRILGIIVDSDGRPALRYPEYEGQFEPATFLYEVPLESHKPPEV